MHEWALADAVVEATMAALGKRDPSCLRGVTVLIGELQAIDREIFSFALETILSERPYHAGLFHLETEKASFRCESCSKEWALEESRELTAEQREAIHFLPESAHAFVRCPACGSPDYRLQKGRGISISSLEVEDREGCT
jgi:hydrogenase nickel incorporation protein HypA/HybF